MDMVRCWQKGWSCLCERGLVGRGGGEGEKEGERGGGKGRGRRVKGDILRFG